MRTTIVYSIVSGNDDTYLEQLLVSLYSVRIYHADAEIEIVTDDFTYATLTANRAQVFQYANKVTGFPCPSGYNKMQRSRYLKTNLRRFVKGDYLFIDCDTVLCERLNNIDRFDGDLGMVADLNGQLALNERSVIEKCTKAGFANVEGQPYFNSGVIYAKDTPAAYRLYAEWYRLWCEADARGCSYDQPALCQANINLGFPIKEMSGIWNCQFKFTTGYKYLNHAKIVHYYSNNGQGSNDFQERIFEYVKEQGRVDAVVDRMIRHPRTIFYTAVTISPDKAFEFFSSEMIHYFFNVPPLYRMMCFMARILEMPILFFSNLKTKFSR